MSHATVRRRSRCFPRYTKRMEGLVLYRCARCGTSEAFAPGGRGDPNWCPHCHAEGRREVTRVLTDPDEATAALLALVAAAGTRTLTEDEQAALRSALWGPSSVYAQTLAALRDATLRWWNGTNGPSPDLEDAWLRALSVADGLCPPSDAGVDTELE